ncbi:SRPBCC family protein [Cellulomonas sp. URHE0023]|uniref:SRPBCC family protein n=1 Tax=Cellulomonas sp. URHE0023 TaxID=1380354 RepID=UPI000488753F|nr:SRPBCC family protein [Cellulomonas sp. URHE0023]
MTDPSVVNSTFTLEHDYAFSPARVFAAWADPATKARWFGGKAAEHHELDFRAGGSETTRGRNNEGQTLTFATSYHDIVTDHRIVYSSTLSVDGTPVTISLTTVLLEPHGDGTTLVLTEHAAYLDGHEQPEWRQQGTRSQLAALADELATGTS